jgi:ATP-dependent DNA helicase RecQ
VTDVLTGRASDKVVASRHDTLSTFGLLREESTAAVRGFIEQLVADRLLLRDGEPYPVLRLTQAGAMLLKGEGSCTLYREILPPKPKKSAHGRRPEVAAAAADPDLFDVLRAVRLRLARQRGVPPYVIFHDTTLREMAERRPSTLDDLHDIYGIGVRKAADFGGEFLEAIRSFSASA